MNRAIPFNDHITRAAIAEDVRGIDYHYVVNDSCPVAVRVRYDRPVGSADVDITFRSTEPAMMRANTYAPLALFLWLVKGEFVKGRLVDVYRLFERADPPLTKRPLCGNGDGTRFLAVTIDELRHKDMEANLRTGTLQAWIAECLGGDQRTRRILRTYRQKEAGVAVPVAPQGGLF